MKVSARLEFIGKHTTMKPLRVNTLQNKDNSYSQSFLDIDQMVTVFNSSEINAYIASN